MGCANIKTQPSSGPYAYSSVAPDHALARFGILTVSIPSCKFVSASHLSSISPYVIATVSNQCFKRKIRTDHLGKNLTLQENFQIAINGRKKQYGRTMIVQVSADGIRQEGEVGLGIVDLDPYIVAKKDHNPKEAVQETRCFINYEKRAAGWMNLTINFIPMQTYSLCFRINSIFVNRQVQNHKPSIVRIIIGQEVLNTQIKESIKGQIMHFIDIPFSEYQNSTNRSNILYFQFPIVIKSGNLQLIQTSAAGDVIVGQAKLRLDRFLTKDGQYSYVEEVGDDDGVSGSICFDVVKNVEDDYQFVYCEAIKELMEKKIKGCQQNFKSNQRKNVSRGSIQQASIPIQKWAKMGRSLRNYPIGGLKIDTKGDTTASYKDTGDSLSQISGNPGQNIASSKHTILYQISTPRKRARNLIATNLPINSIANLMQIPIQVQSNFQIQSSGRNKGKSSTLAQLPTSGGNKVLLVSETELRKCSRQKYFRSESGRTTFKARTVPPLTQFSGDQNRSLKDNRSQPEAQEIVREEDDEGGVEENIHHGGDRNKERKKSATLSLRLHGEESSQRARETFIENIVERAVDDHMQERYEMVPSEVLRRNSLSGLDYGSLQHQKSELQHQNNITNENSPSPQILALDAGNFIKDSNRCHTQNLEDQFFQLPSPQHTLQFGHSTSAVRVQNC